MAATHTPNIGLNKPDRQDFVSVVTDINDNMQMIDDAFGNEFGLEESVAIVVNGDTAPKAITSGQYLFIKNHSTLATGAYHATANIANGGTIDGSNVAADADGVANALNAKLATNASDLNNATNTGIYRVLIPVSNAPVNANGDMLVMANPSVNVIHQIFMVGERSFTRRCLSETWSDWQEIADLSKVDALTTVTTGTITKESSITSGVLANVTCRKVGNTVFASARIHSISPSILTDRTVFVIPSGYRPKATVYCIGYIYIDGLTPVFVTVNTNGNVNFSYSSSSTTNQFAFAGCWSIK